MLANYNESIYLFEEMEICSVNTVILVNYNCMIPILKKNDLPEENFSVVKTELIHFWLPEF